MNGLRDWALSSKQAHAAAADKRSWGWVVHGGRPANAQRSSGRGNGETGSSGGSTDGSYATLYCTGHSDGAVRLWDMAGQVPQLLGTVPSAAAASALSSIRRTKAAAVCTLEFAWEQGLLITGHEGGEVKQAVSQPSLLTACRPPDGMHAWHGGKGCMPLARGFMLTAGAQMLQLILISLAHV